MVEKGKEKSASEASRVLDTRRFFFQRLARSQPNFLWHWLVFVKVTLIVMSLQQDCRKKRTTKRTFVCDKRDGAITCVFCRDLDGALHVFWSFTKSSV